MANNINANQRIDAISVSGKIHTIAPFHGTAIEWENNLLYIPSQGEIVIYDIDDNNTMPRIKIGDGETTVAKLPFFSSTDATQDVVILAEAQKYADNLIAEANLAQYTTEEEVKSIVDGVIASAADSETYNSLTKLVDYIDTHGGEAAEMAQAIETLEGDVKVLKEAPFTGIKTSDIEAWNSEIGAKALAETKTTTAEVKAQIEAYGYATANALATEKSEREAADAALNTAIEAAKADASNKDAVVLAEAQKYTDQAEADAIAAAEGKVNALASNVYTKEQTFTKDEVNAAIETAISWGEF